MSWNDFLKDRRLKFPKDSHSIFSASNYHWTNYSMEKMFEIWMRKKTAAELGTRLHALASELIDLRQPLPDVKKTLNMYVNDAIFYGMVTEKQLYFSDEFKGTADAIIVDLDNILRVHDLKTGETKASFRQLEIYVALFCLESGALPADFTSIKMRIYQNNEIMEQDADSNIIVPIMDKMIAFDEMKEKYYNEIWEGDHDGF